MNTERASENLRAVASLPPLLREQAEGRFQAFQKALGPTDAAALTGLNGDEMKTVFAFSPFVAAAAARHPRMMLRLLESGDLYRTYPKERYGRSLGDALADLIRRIDARPPPPAPGSGAGSAWVVGELQSILRAIRRREMVRIAYRDLSGRADVAETMEDLSGFADACLDRAVAVLHRERTGRFGTPTGKDGSPQQLVVVAMGKLGARELNFSSDIDLIFAYPEEGTTRGGPANASNDDFFTGLCRDLIKVVGANTADGIVFRVDLGLRPFGDSGPVVMHFDALEYYYQSQGREWERYAWIKARVAAGDGKAGIRLMQRLHPFVYRRYLDYGVFDSLREMKQMISQEVRRKKMADNIKLGQGGIREIEFFGQMFQLIRGGVVPALQKRAIVPVLAVLAEIGIIADRTRAELTAAYLFLRRVEHRLQEYADQQTHTLPADPEQRKRLALSMGYPERVPFDDMLVGHMKAVHTHFTTLLEPEPERRSDGFHAPLVKLWLEKTDAETAGRLLAEVGFDTPETVGPLLENLRSASATRALSTDGRRRLDQLMPWVIRAAGKADNPVAVLKCLTDLVKTIEQRTSYLALLIENPNVLAHLVRFADASPWIITYMARHPVLLDELLDPRTLFKPPAKAALEASVRDRLARIPEDDLELFIEEMCIFKQVSTLHVAASDVTGHLPLMKVSDRLTWIAESILDRVLAFTWRQLVNKHGDPDCTTDTDGYGRGFAVIAYGKLGGLELGYDSDLDLVFLHAGGRGATRGGAHPIDTPQFYTRLGQRMVHILTAHTRAGKLYEADMRLRPSGSSGPLVSQIDAFMAYQLADAWTWENQAIVRGRAVCGDPALAARFAAIRKEVLGRPRDRSILRNAVADMRKRLRQEHLDPKPETFDLKQGPGGMVDIEFLAQYLVLLKSGEHPELTRWSDNVRILESLTETGVLDNETAYRLKRAYLTYRATAHRLSLLEKPPQVPLDRFGQLREDVMAVWRRWMAA